MEKEEEENVSSALESTDTLMLSIIAPYTEACFCYKSKKVFLSSLLYVVYVRKVLTLHWCKIIKGQILNNIYTHTCIKAPCWFSSLVLEYIAGS